MKKYLIKMIDGGITNIIEDGWTKSKGCETCGYGGYHIKELELEMETCSLLIDMGDEYDFRMPSCEDLIIWFDKNAEKINNMTESEFVEFIKKDEDCFYCNEISFKLIK